MIRSRLLSKSEPPCDICTVSISRATGTWIKVYHPRDRPCTLIPTSPRARDFEAI